MVRTQLDTFVDGSFLEVDAFVSTLVHRASGAGTHYLKISGFNRGLQPRRLNFTIGDQSSVFATLQPTGNTQLLVPHLPLFNTGTGLDIFASMQQSVNAWSLPTDLTSVVNLQGGRVVGIITLNISALNDAQPILLIITDSRRATGDLDVSKGTEAIVELHQQNGSIGINILNSGENMDGLFVSVTASSGVFLYGDVISE